MMKKKDEFVPHLKSENTGKFYGEIGTPTKMKDINGQPLFVGDVVEVTAKGIGTLGNVYVVERDNKSFVMGIKGCCSADGTIDDDWIVIKQEGYEELKNGEMNDWIKAILEELK